MTDEQIPASAPPIGEPPALEDEKLRLEIEKLKDELHALRLPWWKRPIYIAAVFPTLLALVGAIAAFATGYVQTQYQLVQLLKEKTNNERLDLDAKQQALAVEKTRYEAEKKKMAGEIIELKKQALALPMQYLDAIERSIADHQSGRARDSELALIELIKKDTEGYIVPEVERRSKSAPDAALRVHLLVDLYLGTGDTQWKDQIWSLTRESAEVATVAFLDAFSMSTPWPEKDNIFVIELLAGILKSHPAMKPYSLEDLLYAVRARLPRPERGPKSLRPLFSTNDAFFDLAVVLRDRALDTNAGMTDRRRAMRVLRPVAPHIYLVAVSRMVEENKTTDDVQLMTDFGEKIYGVAGEIPYTWMVQYMRPTLNYPETLDPQKWRDWRQANKSLVDEASEPNLDTWRRNPSKYDALFASLDSPAPKTP